VSEVLGIPVSELHPSKYNPRKNFAKDNLQELAESIRTQGVIQPLLVRPTDPQGEIGDTGDYEIVAGERRYRAAKLAGLETVPCIVERLTDQQAREIQVVENLQREDITPLEEAAGLQALFKMRGDSSPEGSKVSVDDIAKRIGKSPRSVYARLQLLKLAAPVQKALEAGKLEAGHAQELVPLKPAQQAEMLRTIKNRATYAPVSVQDVRSIIKSKYAAKPAPPKISAKEKARRAQERAREKKADAAHKREQAKSAAQQKLRKLVTLHAVGALWKHLQDTEGKQQDALDYVLAEDARHMNGLNEAWIVASGKPLPDSFVRVAGLDAKVGRLPRAQRLAIVLLAHVINDLEWGPAPFASKVLAWAKIDRKAIARELARQDAENAKADAARMKATTAKLKAEDAKRRKEINERAAKARKLQTSAKRKKGKGKK
jgi:ParB family transcriptional regulator, chromosome partitioning protein